MYTYRLCPLPYVLPVLALRTQYIYIYIYRLPPLPDVLSVLAHRTQRNYIYIYIQQNTYIFSEKTAAMMFLEMIQALFFEAVLLFLQY